MRRLRDRLGRRGATALEYALIIGFTTLVIIGAIGSFGDSVIAMYDIIQTAVVEAISGS